MQDKIDEIMGFVYEFALKAEEYTRKETSIDELMGARIAIESKLRDLVREPLELGVVDKEYSDKWSFFDSEYESFVGGVRYAERAHGITNTSGEV